MKFHELKEGQAFYFAEMAGQPFALVISAGVAGEFGRYVSSYSDWRDTEEWLFCDKMAEVVPEQCFSEQAFKEALPELERLAQIQIKHGGGKNYVLCDKVE